MPRTKKRRKLCFSPRVYYFKPRGIPLRQLEEVDLAADEIEAIKLYQIDGYDQTTAAKQMNISQPTFARIFKTAEAKVFDAIINGKAIRIEET